MHKKRTLIVGATGALATVALLAGCSGSPEESSEGGLEIGSVDLSASCPETVVIQTDWNPEAEHGHLYELLGEGYEIDANNVWVTGPLMAGDEYTGVDVQVRSGGPAIGFQTVTAQMYTDEEITLGYSNTDETIQLKSDMPTTAVYAPLEINPQMVMWDPETYPDVEGVEDLVDEGVVIRYFGGAAWMEYLLAEGTVPAELADGSYDGSPSVFVAEEGAVAQQGFASAEPYAYENEVENWMAPVAYQLIHDMGYPIYAAAVSVRDDKLEELSPCLEDLVPVLQQAGVDYAADPSDANAIILEAVDQFATGWFYSEGMAEYSLQTQIDEGLVGNGPDDTVGNFDPERIAEVFDLVTPVFEADGVTIPEGLTAEDLYTNEFIDESISFEG